ncbi:unnamed protein product [Blepharisma stoltei]|uniref:Uncharacterized protein n=1 Tax=Blepharisma stoltei TaxID=1481888 RepID=A0AAU9JHL1_9CILI|nr:unnamed protein product [Blepharisma stoltei]
MEESWTQLQNLEAHIKEHNIQLESLSPVKQKISSQSSVSSEMRLKNHYMENIPITMQQRVLQLSKDVKDKEREILNLQRDLVSLDSYKEQNNNLQLQVKVLREKIVMFEREINQKNLELNNIEGKIKPRMEDVEKELQEQLDINANLQKTFNQLKKESDEKTHIIQSLRQDYTNLENTYKSTEDEKRIYKQKFNDLDERYKGQVDEFERAASIVQEKEQISLALEEDNERLRCELEKAMDSLQKCQVELSFIPKLRQELHQSEQLIAAASRELEKEKNFKAKLQNDKEEAEEMLKKITKATEGNDPVEYIEELLNKLEKSKNDLVLIQDELNELEERQRYADREASYIVKLLSNYFEKISESLKSGIFLCEEIPMFPKIESDVEASVALLYNVLQKCKVEAQEKVREQSKVNQTLTERLNKYEKNISLLREKQEEVNVQIQEQEILSQELANEKNRLEKELEQRVVELENSENIKYKLTEDLEEAKKIIEKTTQILSFDKRGSKNELDSLAKVAMIRLGKAEDDRNRLYEEVEELKKWQDTAVQDKKAYEQRTKEYLSRMQEMSRQIEGLTEIIDQNEKSMKDVLERYNDAITQLHETEKSYKELESDNRKLVYCIEESKNNEEILIKAISFASQSDEKIEILESLSEGKEKSKATEEMVKNFNEFIEGMQEKISKQSNVIVEMNEKIQELMKTRQEKENELEQQRKHRDALEKQVKEMAEKIENLIKENGILVKYQDEVGKLAKNVKKLKRNEEVLEEEVENYKKVMIDLQRTSIELQDHVKILTAQRSELQEDNQLKLKHIKSLEQIVTRLETSLSHADNARIASETSPNKSSEQLSQEVTQLSDLLKKFIDGYAFLESKLNENSKYCENMVRELTVKTRKIQLLEEEKKKIGELEQIVKDLKLRNEALNSKLEEYELAAGIPKEATHPPLHSTSSWIPLS